MWAVHQLLFSRFILPLKVPDEITEDNLVTIKDSKCTAIAVSKDKVKVTDESLTEDTMEMPQFNYGAHAGKKYKFFYSVRIDQRNLTFPILYKV